MAYLSKEAALDQLVAECEELIAHADFTDGLAVCFTQDVEAVESLVAALRSDAMKQNGFVTEIELNAINALL